MASVVATTKIPHPKRNARTAASPSRGDPAVFMRRALTSFATSAIAISRRPDQSCSRETFICVIAMKPFTFGRTFSWKSDESM